MILPFATRTADVTKERVTGTLALPATRSLDAMVKVTEVEASGAGTGGAGTGAGAGAGAVADGADSAVEV